MVWYWVHYCFMELLHHRLFLGLIMHLDLLSGCSCCILCCCLRCYCFFSGCWQLSFPQTSVFWANHTHEIEEVQLSSICMCVLRLYQSSHGMGCHHSLSKMQWGPRASCLTSREIPRFAPHCRVRSCTTRREPRKRIKIEEACNLHKPKSKTTKI